MTPRRDGLHDQPDRRLQSEIIADLNVRPVIDPAAEVSARIEFLYDYVRATRSRGLVLGISGGQDSCLAGRLCQLAVERLVSDGIDAEFVAVRLPYAAQVDEADAQLALAFVRPTRSVRIDIVGGVEGLAGIFRETGLEPLRDFTRGNVKARLRMVAQYAIAGQHGMLVVGTDHAAEAVTGFFTKFGDGAADILPLSGLSKRQGRALLEYLGAPERFRTKAPTADLLDEAPGQTDEDSLGLTYDQIDDFLEGKTVPDNVFEAVVARYIATEHKRRAPVAVTDTWWHRR